MRTAERARRQAWRALPIEDKHQRLASLRQVQQRQVEVEMLRLAGTGRLGRAFP